MFKTYIKWLAISLLILNCFAGCTKFKKEGQFQQPGIALTFDDDRVDNWFKYLDFFDSANVKATFYICKYQRFTPDQKRKLAIIQNHGHEIGFHSANHYNMVDYVYKYKHAMDELMKNEITDGLKQMNRDGFYPTTFAYPYGAHNSVLDHELMRYFKSVRALNGTKDFSKSLICNEHNQVLYGLGIDKSSDRSDEVIMELLQATSDNNNCAVFTAHDINTDINISVTLGRLKKIIRRVKELGLKYYTVSEISK